MNKLLFLAAFLPMTVEAVEVSDTTFTVGGKSIVVDVKGEKTNYEKQLVRNERRSTARMESSVFSERLCR